jgi:hypothetical protein
MSDIFREVDEALQRENAAKLWKAYGPTLIMAAVVMVASAGLTTAYQTWQKSRHESATSALIRASEQTDIAAAMENAAKEASGDHQAIALLNAAAKHAEKKEFAKAAAAYQSAADDSDAPQDLRDFAALMHVRSVVLENAAPDYKILAERIAKIATNEKSAFRHQAIIETALLYGDGLKDYTGALNLLEDFDSASAPASLNEKATALKHVYSYERDKQSSAPQAPAR